KTLNAAAVLGSRFDFDWVSASIEQESSNVLKIAGELVRRHFWLEMPKEYAFIHNKIRQVAYQDISHNERASLHLQAGEALEKLYPERVSSLSFHFYEGKNWEKASRYSYEAGINAANVFANQEALALYNRALDSLEKIPESNESARSFEIKLARESIYARLGEREKQAEELENLEVLAAQSGDNEKEIHRNQAITALRKAQFGEATSNSELSITTAQAAIHHAQIAKDGETEAAAHLEWGVGLWRKGDYKASQPILEQALALARSVNSGRLEADSLRNLGNVCWFQGDYTGAIDFFLKTLDVSQRINDRLGEARTLNNLGLMAEHQGNNSNAVEYYTKALEIYGEVGDRRGESNTFANLANIDLYLGNYLRAMANYKLALPIRQAVGDQEGEAIVLTNLGIVWNHLGHYTKSKEYFEQALYVFREHDNRWGEGYLLAYLGLRAHQMGENKSALKLCEQAMIIAQELESPEHQAYALTFSGHALTALGRTDQAIEAYQNALSLRKDLEQPHLVAETQAGLARLSLLQGDLSQAQSHVEAILEHLKRGSVDGTEEPARIYLTCYHVLLANKDPRADDILSKAHSLLKERAVIIEDPALRRSFLENVATHREILAIHQQLQEQKITVRLPKIEAPTGRPLEPDEWVDVTWTLHASSDNAVRGKTTHRQHRLSRLIDEAHAQGAAPTIVDLATALEVSPATIKRDLTVLRESGLHIQTRGSRAVNKNEPKV
ncbi:MAG: tetratricopeptide repeat protein, partial [Anaerolineales bacterium]